MNILESFAIISPYGKEETCGKFNVTDTNIPFILRDIATVGQEYTFSSWLKSNEDGQISVAGKTFSVTNTWSRQYVTFTADKVDFDIFFDVIGEYYFYHPQLEIGNKMTDWTPALEDVTDRIESEANIANDHINNVNTTLSNRIDDTNSDISSLKDQTNKNTTDISNLNTDVHARLELIEGDMLAFANRIQNMVVDENGTSLMTQTGDGWVFSMASTLEAIKAATENLEELAQGLEDQGGNVKAIQNALIGLTELNNYVKINTTGPEPILEIGNNTELKIQITNEIIRFMYGDDILVYVSNKDIRIPRAEIQETLVMGGFVWQVRENGNLGLTWKGV